MCGLQSIRKVVIRIDPHDRIQIYRGNLVLTPNWTWHDHANDTDAPMSWLDGLDTPLIRLLEAGFYEPYGEESNTLLVLQRSSLAHPAFLLQCQAWWRPNLD